ncbi:eukaryotic protein [Schizosaccharomyces japonicus yFS275]|uniref:Queuosine 5'-phosphate N-glycosylase/hydrolase n=1 Tax=Schizosaccharomyces japonicus (strain yFS275 / FY16936) TaxID=402676 RepID=B6JYW0_SCHJY|nr:eukaryotic protein [Schizosaccharomyces japonicus yFS275]EEB06728.1 eukaryotic protein [Schizosaccharomyces japonicus yFS275]
MICVLEDSKFIAGNAVHVRVNEDGCKRVAASIVAEIDAHGKRYETWDSHELHPQTKDTSTLDWIFFIDLLNFSFWSKTDVEDTGSHPERFAIEYHGKRYTGYWSLCAAVNRMLERGIPITDPKFYADVERCPNGLIAEMFSSATSESVPMLKERIQVLREGGRVLVEKYDGSYANLLKQCSHSAQRLLTLLLRDFPNFNDTSVYRDRNCYILKRAQILVAETWACFGGKDWGRFDDIDTVTMFADYRVPQILWQLECLDYSEEFEGRLRNHEQIAHGDVMEVEMRGCSIWAVECIRKWMPKYALNAIEIDFYLWDLAKEWQSIAFRPDNSRAHQQIPCIEVRSIYY